MTHEREDGVEQAAAAQSRARFDVDASSTRVAGPIWWLSAALQAARQAALAAHGLDHSTLDVLETLSRSGAPYRLAAGELSRRCRVTAGATTQRVVRLEAAGFVRRIREKPDRRTVYVELTPRGLQRLDEAHGDVIDADERVLAPLSAQDRQDLERILLEWMHGADLDPITPAPSA